MSISETGYWIEQSPVHYHDGQLIKALIEFFQRKKALSVYDFGCDDGFYTEKLLEFGISCIGFDGNPYLDTSKEYLKNLDLTKPIENMFCDWCLCLEVAEHIPAKYQEQFLRNIQKATRTGIILSWAVPGQIGEGHVSCKSNKDVEQIMSWYGFKRNKDEETVLRKRSTMWWFRNTIMVYEVIPS